MLNTVGPPVRRTPGVSKLLLSPVHDTVEVGAQGLFSNNPAPYALGMDLRVLGPLEAAADGVPVPLGGPKQRLVLALLLVEDGRPLSVDALADGLWGESPPTDAPSSIHTYISRLRGGLGECLRRRSGGYVLQLSAHEVDACRFERLLSDGRNVMATDPTGAAQLLLDGLALWRGPPYADLHDEPALQAEICRLEELHTTALEERVEADLALGHHRDLIAELEVLSADFPFRERFQRQHMLALYRCGRQVEALRAYQHTRSMLAEAFGIDPGRELQDLEEQILRHDSLLELDIRSADDMVVAESDSRQPRSPTEWGWTAETCTAAFLFTDVEDSTVLWDTDHTSMEIALAGHDQIVERAVEAAGGRVFKHTGDGMLSLLPDVDSAIDAAIHAMQGLATADWGKIGPLPVRMAIDFGEALVRTNDLSGPVLNRASRLLALADAGQLLLSETARRAVQNQEVAMVDLGEQRLKGLAPARVYELSTAPSSAATGMPSQLLAGRPSFGDHIRGYELEEVVGEGDLATVYRATQHATGREVAIKVLRPELAGDPGFVRCFEPDAKLVAQLEHPHINPLYDYWREGEAAYLVMRFVRGGSLRIALDRGAWHLEPALVLLDEMRDGLCHAHRHGIIHRGIHPSNILLNDDGNALLTDFGVASGAAVVFENLSDRVRMYVAPEVRVGEPFTVRSDIYSLGMVARELLTGHLAMNPLHANEDAHHDLPSGCFALLTRATADEPDERFETVGDFVDSLHAVANRSDHRAGPSGFRGGSPSL